MNPGDLEDAAHQLEFFDAESPHLVAAIRGAASRIDHLEKALQRIEKHVLEPQAARIARAALKGEDE